MITTLVASLQRTFSCVEYKTFYKNPCWTNNNNHKILYLFIFIYIWSIIERIICLTGEWRNSRNTTTDTVSWYALCCTWNSLLAHCWRVEFNCGNSEGKSECKNECRNEGKSECKIGPLGKIEKCVNFRWVSVSPVMFENMLIHATLSTTIHHIHITLCCIRE